MLVENIKCTNCGENQTAEHFAPSHIRTNRNGKKTGLCRPCNTEIQRNLRQQRQPSIKNKVGVGVMACTICTQEKTMDYFRWNSRTGYRTECEKCEETWLRCSNCNQVKLHEEFPPAKNTIGRHSWCNVCHAKKQTEKYHNDPKTRENHAAYQKTERAKAWRRRYIAQPEVQLRRRIMQRETSRDRWHNQPIERYKHKARVAVGAAVKKGKIIKPTTCQANGKYGAGCMGGTGPIEGHHYLGYWPKAVWLQVEWLCPVCHLEADRQQKETGYLLLDDRNPALAAAKDKLAIMTEWMGLDAQDLFDLTMDCSGEDEMDVILNFFEWLKINNFEITKKKAEIGF